MTLRARIIEEIEARGSIRFSRYMEMCLYEPGLGFYERSQEPTGLSFAYCLSLTAYCSVSPRPR